MIAGASLSSLAYLDMKKQFELDPWKSQNNPENIFLTKLLKTEEVSIRKQLTGLLELPVPPHFHHQSVAHAQNIS